MTMLKRMMMGVSKDSCPDGDTLLLIESNDSDGATSFTDISSYAHTVTVANQTQHDTAQKKFGASSILFDGSGDALTLADNALWDLAGDFTIDFWMRTGGAPGIMNRALNSTASNITFNAWLGGAGAQLSFYFFTGSTSIILNGGANLNNSAWYHIAAVRSGSSFFSFINGVAHDTATSAGVLNTPSAPVTIGKAIVNGSGDFNGHMDEIRFSNTARWTGAFTPDTSPYC